MAPKRAQNVKTQKADTTVQNGGGKNSKQKQGLLQLFEIVQEDGTRHPACIRSALEVYSQVSEFHDFSPIFTRKKKDFLTGTSIAMQNAQMID